MKGSLLRITAIVVTLALGACSAEDTQTTQQDIDHDITVTHGSGAMLDNLGQSGFAPWHFTGQPSP
jgi:ABC-type glycerol-3-phosphate transport system substrate-binding protein